MPPPHERSAQAPPGWAARATQAAVQALVAELLARPEPPEPAALALSLRRSHPELAAEVATQLELSLRARRRLPTWAAAGAAWHRQALEQATSEAAAQRKWAGFAGEHALDLTAGLGVDAWALAQRYARVTALEADADRAALLRHNLARLGVTNATVVHTDAAEWLARYDGPPADLAYADPARRSSAHARAVALADLAPDPRVLMPLLPRAARALRLKLSPLYDLSEAARVWPTAQLGVLSLAGEVKEVLVDVKLEPTSARFTGQPSVTALGDDYTFAQALDSWPGAAAPLRELGAYVWLPDAALVKARLDTAYARAHLPGAGRLAADGFWSLDALPDAAPPGRLLSVVAHHPYKPDRLKKLFAEQGLSHAHVLARGAHDDTATARRRLGLAEGGHDYILIGQSRSGPVCAQCRPTD